MSRDDEPWPGFEPLTEEQAAKEFAERTRAWHDGDYAVLSNTVAFCGRHSLPLPAWATEAALDAMFYAVIKGFGARGKGKTGGIQKQMMRSRIQQRRHYVASYLLAERSHCETRRDAFLKASEKLRGTWAQGSASAIEASYNKQVKQLRKKPQLT